MSKPFRNFIILVAVVAAILYVVPGQSQQANTQPLHASFTRQSNASPPAQRSHTVLRISQLDPGQYTSQAEFQYWAYAACSAAAMTEIANAYGGHFRIHDILVVEERVREITQDLGLLHDGGIERTMAQPPFNMRTTWGYDLSYQQVIAKANSGTPVIVSWPPSRYQGGHLVVVTGGNDSVVYLADSSIFNRHALSRAQFMRWWGGFFAVVRPTGLAFGSTPGASGENTGPL